MGTVATKVLKPLPTTTLGSVQPNIPRPSHHVPPSTSVQRTETQETQETQAIVDTEHLEEDGPPSGPIQLRSRPPLAWTTSAVTVEHILKIQEKDENQVKNVIDLMSESPITEVSSGLKVEATFEEKLAVYETIGPDLVDALWEQEARKRVGKREDTRYPKSRAKLSNIDPQMRTGLLFGKDFLKLLKLAEKSVDDGIDQEAFVGQAAGFFKIESEKVKLLMRHYATPSWTFNRKVLSNMPVGYDRRGRKPFSDIQM